MPLPSDASKANCDSIYDDPKQALLVDLAGVIDTVNALLAHLRAEGVTLSGSNVFTTDQRVDRSGAAAAVNVGSDQSTGVVAEMKLFGHNASGSNINYAEIEAEVVDATAGSEDSRINFRNYRNGDSGVGMYLRDGLVMAGVGNDMGTGTINALRLYINDNPVGKGTPLVLNPYTVNTTVTQAHGLGVEPTLVKVVLECLTAELGYSVGDKIILSPGDGAENNNTATFSLLVNATNLVLVTHQNALPNIVNKSTRTNSPITAANWKLTATPVAVG